MTVTIRGEVRPSRAPFHHWGIRVRALQNAQPVFVMDLTAHEPRLGDPGRFEATVKLQANTGGGYFSLETPMWNTQERREVGRGPHTISRVQGSGFQGTTNLHARVHVATELKYDSEVATR